MTFDTTVTLVGLAVQIVTLAVGGIALYVKIRERITELETKLKTQLEPMWTWWSDDRLPEREEWKKAMESHLDHTVRSAVHSALWQTTRNRPDYEG